MQTGILKFQEVYMERIWGGKKLQHVLDRNVPAGAPVGEAWLIADHPACESIVTEGPYQEKTLRELMQKDSTAILGNRVKPTADGRFPLLLKLIDAGDVLSVQVHPDDDQAEALHEPDGGKTEMWYILDADQESQLFVGLCPGISRKAMATAVSEGDADKLMHAFPVKDGDSIFVSSGIIHAIGAGILLAEIQQNSDITYRLYDWNRKDVLGNSRQLHVDKALQVINFNAPLKEPGRSLRYEEDGRIHEVLSACSYFATEKLILPEEATFKNDNTFHIIHAIENEARVTGENTTCLLKRGEAALIPANEVQWTVKTQKPVLHYFVPNIQADIVAPLQRHGYTETQIHALAI